MTRLSAIAIAAAALLAACQKTPEGDGDYTYTPDPAVTPEVRTEAEKLYADRCVPCHGAQGVGDGPAAAGLNPRPRNLRDKGWQSSVSNEHIEKIVQFGGGAVGKSPAMPPNPDLAGKPAVVAALRDLVRSFGQ